MNSALQIYLEACNATQLAAYNQAVQNCYGTHTHNIQDPGHSHSSIWNSLLSADYGPTEAELDKYPAMAAAWEEFKLVRKLCTGK